jgi:hypothetical protein
MACCFLAHLHSPEFADSRQVPIPAVYRILRRLVVFCTQGRQEVAKPVVTSDYSLDAVLLPTANLNCTAN